MTGGGGEVGVGVAVEGGREGGRYVQTLSLCWSSNGVVQLDDPCKELWR